MLRNNADVRRSVYFELGVPVVLLCVSRNIPLPCKAPPSPFFLFKKAGKERPSSREINIEGMIHKLDIGKSVISFATYLIQTKEQYQCLKYCSYLKYIHFTFLTSLKGANTHHLFLFGFNW